MTPKRYFTDSEEEEIAKIYRAGYSIHQIARAYQRGTSGVISCAIRRQGVIRRQFRFVHHRDSTIFHNIDTEEKAYWLGFLYADGCTRKSLIQLSLSSRDLDHVQRFAHFIGDAPCSVKKSGYKDFLKATATIYDMEMANSLRALGIVTHRPDYTAAINNIPSNLLHHFLRGNFDGDGCATNDGPSLLFCGKRPFITFVRDYMAQCVHTNPQLTIRDNVRSKKTSYLSFRRRIQALKVADYLYQDATVFLKRKKEIVDSWR